MKTIVAFCGLAGSGKDTSCNYLVEKYDFRKTSFAEPLKQMVKIAFNFTDKQLWGSSSNREEQDERYPFSGICIGCGVSCTDYTKMPVYENDLPAGYWFRCTSCGTNYPRFVSARLALQTIGTEWGRRLTPNLWAQATTNLLQLSDYDRWCISDLRFRNELEAVKSIGGATVRLARGKPSSNHPSETELLGIQPEEFTAWTNNEGSVADLHGDLDLLMKYLGLGVRT